MNHTEKLPSEEYLQTGLNPQQVQDRIAAGHRNELQKSHSRTAGQIIVSHVCTLFNFINFVLAAALIAVGSYKNTLFILIVLANLFLGVFQELRAKRAVDKLSVVSASTANVLRENETQISIFDIVKDDLLVLYHGQQIPVDCTLLQGEIEADESCVTGESNGVKKTQGDTLLAGSFVLCGHAKAQVTAVGADCYIAALAREGKKLVRPHSEIMSALKRIIFILSLCVVPLGIATFFIQFNVHDGNIARTVTATAAAILGMIPDGLVLLTSTVLAVGVLRLSRKQVLVQELYCIENLARVDTLCLDKTGTLTEGRMTVEQLIVLDGTPEELHRECCCLINALKDNNATYRALQQYFNEPGEYPAPTIIKSFNSKNKWSGASFDGYSLVWGAPEYVLPSMSSALKAQIDELSKHGRVLLLAKGDAPLGDELPPLTPRGIITIKDVVRADAAETLSYFYEQDVDIYVFSGDGKSTVELVASDCGIKNCEAVDASCTTEEQLKAALETHRLFARVSPLQKQLFVRHLKEHGRTVAFVGDGVNDVPALKESDCSVAMGNGTDAARSISQLVLLSSAFSSLPSVVAEGRRSINNLQRSSALFLVKTIYSTLLMIFFMIAGTFYPFLPIQMSLLSSTGIGIPSFILALEPNKKRIRGSFFGNVLKRCIPGGITVFISICALYAIELFVPTSNAMLSSACVIITGLALMINLYFVSAPLNGLRGTLLALMCTGFAAGVLLFQDFFSIVLPTGTLALCIGGLAVLEVLLFVGIRILVGRLIKKKVQAGKV